MEFKDISKIKQLTFKLEIGIIDVYDNDGNTVTNQYKNNQLNINKLKKTIMNPYLLINYKWKVNDKQLIQNMKIAKNGKSPTFSFKLTYICNMNAKKGKPAQSARHCTEPTKRTT